MPKIKTAQSRRESALIGAVARGMDETGIRRDCHLAEKLGIAKTTFSRYRSFKFQVMQLRDFSKMARLLGLTGKEVCEAIGVPYEDQ